MLRRMMGVGMGLVMALVAAVFSWPAVATAGGAPEATPDPFEAVNRLSHRFNLALYQGSEEAAEGGQWLEAWVPAGLRRGLVNFYANMGEPVTAIASLLRGETDNAERATRRFFVNVLFGYWGVVDRASELGMTSETKDFGQALCRYGVPDGPYLVLPFYGPATVADLAGAMVVPVAGYVTFGLPFAAYRAGQGLSLIVDEHGEAAASASAGPADPADTVAGRTAAAPPKTSAAPDADYEAERARYLARRQAFCAALGVPSAGSPEPAYP